MPTELALIFSSITLHLLSSFLYLFSCSSENWLEEVYTIFHFNLFI